MTVKSWSALLFPLGIPHHRTGRTDPRIFFGLKLTHYLLVQSDVESPTALRQSCICTAHSGDEAEHQGRRPA